MCLHDGNRFNTSPCGRIRTAKKSVLRWWSKIILIKSFFPNFGTLILDVSHLTSIMREVHGCKSARQAGFNDTIVDYHLSTDSFVVRILSCGIQIRVGKTYHTLLWLLSLSSKLPFSVVAIDAFHWAHGYFSFRIIEIQWIAEIFGIFTGNKSYLKWSCVQNRRNYFTFFHCTHKTSVRLSGISVPLRSIVEYRTSFSDDLFSKIPFSITTIESFFSVWLNHTSPTPSKTMPSLKVKIRDALKHVLNVFAYREKVYDLPKNGGPFLVGFDCIQYRLYRIKREKRTTSLLWSIAFYA